MKSVPLTREAVCRFLAVFNKLMGLLALFALSFPSRYINVLLSGWAISWLFDAAAAGRLARPRFQAKYLAIYSLLVIYLLMAVSLAYTENLAYAGRLFERRLAFVILPLVAMFGLSAEYDDKTPYIKAFIAGNVVSLLVSIAWPLGLALFTDTFQPADLTGQVRLFLQDGYVRPTELGLFAIAGWLLGVYLYRGTPAAAKRLGPVWFQLVWGIYLLLIFGWMWLLGSRLNMLTALFMAAFLLFRDLWGRHRWCAVGAALLGVVLLGAVYHQHPRFKLVQPDSIHFTSDFRSQDPRMGIWYGAVQILNEDHCWLTGLGVGDVRDRLVEKYQQVFANEQRILARVTREKRHVHNNFLEMTLEMGLPALLVLVFLLVWPLGRCHSHPSYWLVLLLWLCVLMRMMVDAPFVNLREIAGFCFLWLFFADFDAGRKPA